MVTEQVLKSGRDAALRLLTENRGQVRDGVELLVREKMGEIIRASRAPGEPPLPPAQAEALYAEVLTLAYNLFALGYTISTTEHHLPE